jgi:DNA-directed RNA polymerase II subunit RPB7
VCHLVPSYTCSSPEKVDMYFLKELTHTVQLHPMYFGPRMQEFVELRLRTEVEGSCSGRFGYIVVVLRVNEISRGRVIPNLGLADFHVRYTAVVFKPFKGEVQDGIVTTVNKMGFFVDVGPLQVFVSTHVCVSCCVSWV